MCTRAYSYALSMMEQGQFLRERTLTLYMEKDGKRKSNEGNISNMSTKHQNLTEEKTTSSKEKNGKTDLSICSSILLCQPDYVKCHLSYYFILHLIQNS